MTVSNINGNLNSIDTQEVYVFPASFAQKRLWFLDQFEPGSPYYNIPLAFRMKGQFDFDIFSKTIQEIINRHESLRTSFDISDGEPVQVIYPELQSNVNKIELKNISQNDIDKKISDLATKEARTGFDLSKLPLFRVTVIELSDNDHVVLITMHHIISDGWSVSILIGEIIKIYSAFSNQQPNPFKPLEIQYPDFSEWQKEQFKGGTFQKQLEYWIDKLSNSNSHLELPIDFNRPSVWTNNGSSISRILVKEIIDGLKKINKENGTTLFMSLFTAFVVLLHKLSGEEDINVGTPIANRTNEDIEKIIGLFINTLVLRTNLNGNPTFIELLDRVKNSTLEAYENQDIPFEYLVEKLQPKREMSYAPLYQVMFILQNNPISNIGLKNLELSMLKVDMGTSTSDLTFSLSEGISGISCEIEFNTDLFKESTIHRFFNYYSEILKKITDQPNLKLSEICILNNDETLLVTKTWNSNILEYNNELCIHNLFERWAVKTPNEVAVVFENQKIDYITLNSKANQLADYLINNYYQSEIIGILLNKSIDLIITLLGVLKSGKAYLPIDPSYPKDRIEYMIEDSKLSLIISDSSHLDLLSQSKTNYLFIDNWYEFENYSVNNPLINILPNNLAYVIYTSGSTGRAKGTMIQHDSLVNIYFGWEKDYSLLNTAKSHLQMASFSFDVFGGDWTRALCSGGKLVLVSREILLEAAELYNLMIKESVTIAEFVPAVLRNLIEYLEKNNLKLEFFKILIAGSDIWYVREYKNFLKYCGKQTRLINSFGLTEATIDSSFFESIDLNIPDDRLVPIGRPFPNIRIYILDNYFNPQPIGIKGELYVAGLSVARGYLYRAELTAEKFLPDPFTSINGERMYKTGDVAKFLPDGNIEFLGRADNQIKLRGFRIELGEIESTICKFNGIKDNIVIINDIMGDKKILSYYTTINTDVIDVLKLREFLLEQLPEYMIPSSFIKLDSFPLTPNGKIDRKNLPIPQVDSLIENLKSEYIAPRNHVEEVIANIWSEILNIKLVGIFDNFFILGGHSLLATQVISRIKKALNIEISLRSIFEVPTIAGLSKVIFEKSSQGTGILFPEIQSRKSNIEIPLSFSQQRLWFLDQLEPNSPYYNMPENYLLEGEFELDIFENAVNELVMRHEILRTKFIIHNEIPNQFILDELKISIPLIDFCDNENDYFDQEIQKYLANEAAIPFDLTKCPLFRIKIIHLADRKYIISFVIHHIISDDWSSKIMLREIGIIYDSIIKRNPSPLPNLNIQYADFALWQKNWFSGKVLNDLTEYWKNKLNNLPPILELPYDYPRPAIQTFNGNFKSFYLEDYISNKIKDICQNEGVTVFMFLLSAFYVLLNKLSNQTDICIGTPVANRNRAEIEPLIGFFVNTLALRTNINETSDFNHLLHEVKQTSLEAYSNQDLPFEYLVDILQPGRNMSHSPIFQVMFVFQNETQLKKVQNLESGLKISSIESHSGTSKFDLTLFIALNENKIGGAIEYNTDLFKEETIKGYIKKFQNIIEVVVKEPQIRIKDISLINNESKIKLVKKLNESVSMKILNDFVHKEIERVCYEYPQEIAVEYEGKRYSYEELNIDSNKLAKHLIDSGISSETIVGLLVERSYESIVGILGILKSGGAYLPIDIKYPELRRNYIIEDSAISLILVSEKSKEINVAPRINKINISEIIKANIKDDHNISPKVNIDKGNLCYLIYTSGSTGNPKGTLLTHEGLNNYLSWCLQSYPVKEGNGTVLHSTLSFDATITSIFPALLGGKKIIISEESNDVENLSKILIKNKNLSYLKITPAHLEIITNSLLEIGLDEITKSLIIGGENLTYTQIEKWQKKARNTLIFNEYGPTETVVGCIVYETHNKIGNKSVPIGKVIPNMKVYVLDKNFEQIPEGVIGELYIGGVSLARGYLNKPNLTAEKFIPNPYADYPGERIYKTGDLVKIMNDGNLIFIGRADTQVKIRGYRVEIGEIEEQLKHVPEIKDVCVIKHNFALNDERLVAYLVYKNNPLKHDELISYLQNSLPDYMIPKIFVQVEYIPLTINGKVDRTKLPEPKFEREDNNEFVAPTTAIEKEIEFIWQELLKVNDISIYDNFFQLGGHSLLVTQLVSRVNNRLNSRISLRTVFEFPTLIELSKAIESSIDDKILKQKIEIKPVKREGRIPLSFNQQRLWFLDKLEPGQSIYNMPMALRIRGVLNFEYFVKTVNSIFERHEILRTNFIEFDGKPYQIIKSAIKPKIEFINLMNDNRKESKVNEILISEAFKPFNLSEDQLLRIIVINLTENENIISFTMHHIISDGWSVNVLLKEFISIYLSLSSNDNYKSEGLPIQYADYVIWQRKYLEGKIIDDQLNYWLNKLKNSDHILELPIDKPRPKIKTFNGSHLTFNFNQQTINKVVRISQQLSVTPFMVLITTFQILLSKYTGKKEICVGTPVANRNLVELENLIGFFANTLVIMQKIEGQLSFKQLLSDAKISILKDFENQDVLFEKLVDAIQPERDLRFTPLFQVMFVLQNNQSLGYNSDALSIEPIISQTTSTQYDITLSINISENIWSGTFEYNTDLFFEDSISKMILHYEELLNQLIDKIDYPVGHISYLSKIEKEKLIFENNKTEFKFTDEKTLLEIFDRVVTNNAENIAVEYDGIKISYTELDERSNKIAKYLKDRHVHKEEVIAVLLDKEEWLIEWILGILKAGCVYLPIDLNLPLNRVEYILEDANVTKIVTNKFDVKNNRFEIIKVAEIKNEIDEINFLEFKNRISEESLAYSIYTSGSTGFPKGVMINHKGIKNLVLNQISEFNIELSSRILLFASLSFDASISEIFMSLMIGSTLVVLKNEKLREIEKIEELINKYEITAITLPPSLLNILDVQKINSLKTIISAGEELKYNIAEKWLNKVSIYNAYGPTESSIGVSNFLINSSELYEWQQVPIGKPIKNIQLYILDEYLNPVEYNVVGELCIGGIGLARGYINNPSLTAEKFIPNPFPKFGGERLYLTGDLAKYSHNGNIIFIRRKDDQVKVRGYRIELSEIENKLLEIPEIKEAAVLVKGKDEAAILKAYIVVDTEKEINVNDIKNNLSNNIPDYMIPATFIKLDSIPLNNNGKVDKKKLLLMDDNFITEVNNFIPASNETEKALSLIWSELLGIDNISIHNSFFELGGNSLLVTQLASRIKSKFGTEISIKDLFEYSTIYKQSNFIGLNPKKVIISRIERFERPDKIPLSFAQQRLWILDNLQESNVMYNIHTALKIKGEVKIDFIKQVFRFLVNKHEILRTNFKVIDKNPVQFIRHSSEFTINEYDLSQSNIKNKASDIEKLLLENAYEPFDLEYDNLLRVLIIIISEEEVILSFTMHHIITDGWSINLLIKEFSECYNTLLYKRELLDNKSNLQYADFALWQRKYLSEEVIDSQINYWKKKLGSTKHILELPFDRSRPSQKTFNGDRIFFELSNEIKQKVDGLCNELNLTPFMVLLSFYFILLHKYANQKIVRVGTPIANRNNSELEKIIGFFANTLVLNSELENSISYTNYLNQVKLTALDAYNNQDIQFEKLVDILEPERDLSITPLFQAMFVLQNNKIAISQNNTSNLQIQNIELNSYKTQFDVTLSIEESQTGYNCWFEYNTDLFNKETIEHYILHFKNIVEALLAQPRISLDNLKLLNKSEEDLIIRNSIKKIDKFLYQKNVIQLFDEICSKYPDNICLTYYDKEITYSEIKKRSDSVRSYLLSLNLQKEEVIGVFLNKEEWLVEIILGILKAGCTYLPIDTNLPTERINFIIDDSNISKVISNKKTGFGDRVKIIEVDKFKNNFTLNPNEKIFIEKDQLAYIIYTSGSTGLPKGTMLTHKGLVNLALNQINDFGIISSNRILQFASLSFDASISEIFMSLLSGANLILIDETEIKESTGLKEIINRYKIDVATIPPSLLSILSPNDFSQLKTIISAGEEIKIDTAVKWANNKNLYNAYGPTESTIGVTSYKINLNQISKLNRVPIGQKIKNVQILILDENLNIIPNSVIGELFIAGVGLGRGYLNRPDLTAEKFIPNMYSNKSVDRLYRTGDLAKINSEGLIEFLGRKDTQIKVRGYRIELGEIESKLLESKNIKEAVVAAFGEGENKNLVGYLVEGDGEIDIKNIQEDLSKKLPKYMIPSKYLVIKEIPKNASGKIDRKMLPKPNEILEQRQIEFAKPQSDIEIILFEMWSSILKFDKFGIENSFFELGGNSILAIQLAAKIQDEFDLDFQLINIFQNPTIKSFAKLIEMHLKDPEVSNSILVPFNIANDSIPLFLIHPSGGSVHWYSSLSKALGKEQSTYGIQAVGIDGKGNSHQTIEEMASYYISVIQKTVSNSPFVIASWSMGVSIVFEMAHQLKRRKIKLHSVIILDQGPINPHSQAEDNAEFLLKMFMGRLKFDLENLRKLDYDEQLKHVLKLAKKSGIFPLFLTFNKFKNYVSILKIQQDAWRNYNPKLYTGDIHLIKSSENTHEYANTELLGWEKLIKGNIYLHHTSGDHNTMLHPTNVSVLAKIISQIINKGKV